MVVGGVVVVAKDIAESGNKRNEVLLYRVHTGH
jgi:hypothetical protein